VISIDDFKHDVPWVQKPIPPAKVPADLIQGVVIDPLFLNVDGRGSLVTLKNAETEADDPIVYVYRVTAEARSVRAWVYHRWQDDRLAYTEGKFRIVLFDLRKESPSFGKLNVIEAGADNPLRLRIPAFVVHGVQNYGDSPASFVNMPTRAYDPQKPDKSRISYPDPRIPYVFG
jgi:dTDP-4-dehydrorhamnose 3,5-epimerase